MGNHAGQARGAPAPQDNRHAQASAELVGAEQAGFYGGFLEQGGCGGEVVVGGLEEDVGGFPVGLERAGVVEFSLWIKLLAERLHGIEFHRALAAVAKGVEQCERGLSQGLYAKVLEGGLDGFAEVGIVG